MCWRLSPRSARRILDGEIDELSPILERITIAGQTKKGEKRGKDNLALRDGRSFKLGKLDAEKLSAAVKEAFADIAEQYYLEGDVEPSVRSSKDRIVITIPVVKHL